jgi:3'-phosphoadenosine 5'-phosphosulfate sulfotransferase (PAPS reductase)/FAD synthetase
MKYLSFGAGVQTTALLLMYYELKFDEVIFADTGAELPETYEYMEKYSIPFMEEKGIKFTIVKGNEKGINNLEDYCLNYKISPSIQLRWCTDKFKIKPITNYILSKPKSDFPAIAVLGISYDEAHRIRQSPYNWQINEYPLVDKKITREQCKKIITKYGWSIPPKSGCYFCPFQSEKEWKELYFNYPDLYERAIQIEENGQQFPKFKLLPNGVSLRELRIKFGYGNHRLEEYNPEMSCELRGYCGV